MIYLKGIFVGLAAVFLVFGILPLLAAIIQFLIFFVVGQRAGGFGIAFGLLQWHAPPAIYLFFVVAVFAIAFAWTMRRLARK